MEACAYAIQGSFAARAHVQARSDMRQQMDMLAETVRRRDCGVAETHVHT